ncbi:MAG: hypothetical protein WAM14_18190, partial [Candidatus Nitrosopolaris sp.]
MGHQGGYQIITWAIATSGNKAAYIIPHLHGSLRRLLYLRLAHPLCRLESTDQRRDPNFQSGSVLDGYTEHFGNC